MALMICAETQRLLAEEAWTRTNVVVVLVLCAETSDVDGLEPIVALAFGLGPHVPHDHVAGDDHDVATLGHHHRVLEQHRASALALERALAVAVVDQVAVLDDEEALEASHLPPFLCGCELVCPLNKFEICPLNVENAP
jgi:hypothetical protein